MFNSANFKFFLQLNNFAIKLDTINLYKILSARLKFKYNLLNHTFNTEYYSTNYAVRSLINIY